MWQGQALEGESISILFELNSLLTSYNRLIAMMLGRLRMSVDKCLSEFTKLSGKDLDKGPLPTHHYTLPKKNRTWPSVAYEKAFKDLFDSHIAKSTDAKYDKREFKSDPGRCKT